MNTYKDCIIYKIKCNDLSITDEYYGHTINKKRRFISHKYYCNYEKSRKYNYPLYKFIRNNGGISNFIFEIIEEYPCENKQQAELREKYWIKLKSSSLNKQVPAKTKEEKRETKNKKYSCECGGTYTYSHKLEHLNTLKHLNYVGVSPQRVPQTELYI
jgi:hypothetical protein